VLGYGLDYDEQGRNLPSLYVLRGSWCHGELKKF
jgi:hypoxanthine-guanine phosphoribosyltransferase